MNPADIILRRLNRFVDDSRVVTFDAAVIPSPPNVSPREQHLFINVFYHPAYVNARAMDIINRCFGDVQKVINECVACNLGSVVDSFCITFYRYGDSASGRRRLLRVSIPRAAVSRKRGFMSINFGHRGVLITSEVPEIETALTLTDTYDNGTNNRTD
ncbi:MAG: hypothetical protein D6800_03705 [Candidatus Zixiibacteriota bacterium]|nr:MAG: hypothetical protein D6800_03705 [candidate division Zixibacteria bacterium]